MATGDGAGQEVQVLKTNGRRLKLDGAALRRILLADRVKDKPVVVVSAVGAFRKGKSFLLNFFLRYLRNMGRVDWLGDPDAPLQGFGWRGGSDRHTKGILIWNEVFLVTTPDGQEVAVLLMDTQGTFDCETTDEVHSAIFALGIMLSSVVIYNVSQNIQEDDLQHLQLFAEYGLLAQEVASSPSFDGRLSGIDEEFMTQIQQLVESVLAPSNLLVKEVNGSKIMCGDLVTYFEAYVHTFRRRSVPEPLSVLKATMKASNLAAKDRARDFYITELKKALEQQVFVPRSGMEGLHRKLLDDAIKVLEDIPKMGGEEYSRHYKDILIKEIEAIFDSIPKCNGDNDRQLRSLFLEALATCIISTPLLKRRPQMDAVITTLGAAAIIPLAAAGLTELAVHAFQGYRRNREPEERRTTLDSSTDEDSGSNLSEDETEEVADSSRNEKLR
ncbi:hypothetical protein V5799_016995 [Amblyomma americanum]|uniref:GB1/RHD3-type G domain-containing protein n=1 Tax=Amblyomma americanum TaxID=6943 RepID=A0AAQ4F3E9_AMBAM